MAWMSALMGTIGSAMGGAASGAAAGGATSSIGSMLGQSLASRVSGGGSFPGGNQQQNAAPQRIPSPTGGADFWSNFATYMNGRYGNQMPQQPRPQPQTQIPSLAKYFITR